jgi:dTDP-4-amino-4,6-dideoxygalactose transaminase
VRAKRDDLAINGGEPLRKQPFPVWPYFWDEEKQAAAEVLDSNVANYWAGTKGMEFERKYAEWVGTDYAIAVCNGGAALQAAVAAVGAGPGDEVIVTPFTFIASPMCILWQNAVPVFADIDPATLCIDPADIERKITDRTRAIISVHIYGQPCDMEAIMGIADYNDLYVIEDCAQSHGAEYAGRKTGSIGHIAAFSFCQTKHMTTGGEGGMVTTSDPELHLRARSFKDYGARLGEFNGTRWVSNGPRLGFGQNLRMTEMQSAMGCALVDKLDWFVKRRRENVARITQGLADVHVITPFAEPPGTKHSYFGFPCLLDTQTMGMSGAEFAVAVAAEGVPVRGGTMPDCHCDPALTELAANPMVTDLYEPPVYDGQLRYGPGVCPVAERVGRQHFVIEVYPTIEPSDCDDIVAAIHKVVAATL